MPDISDKLVIRLMIGKQQFAFNISRDKEEVYRKGAVYVNERLREYQTLFPGQAGERYLSTVALDIAMNLLQQKEKQSTLPFLDTLAELTNEIEDVIDAK